MIPGIHKYIVVKIPIMSSKRKTNPDTNEVNVSTDDGHNDFDDKIVSSFSVFCFFGGPRLVTPFLLFLFIAVYQRYNSMKTKFGMKNDHVNIEP